MEKVQDPSVFFTDLMTGYRRAKNVFTACRLGVFDALKERARSVDEIASELACNPASLGFILDGLAATGVIDKTKAGYRHTSFSEKWLAEGSLRSLHHNLLYQDYLWDGWSELEQAARSGQPWRRLPELLEDPAFKQAYLKGVASLRGPAEAVGQLLSGLTPARVLDLGGGAGAYTSVLAGVFPQAEITLFDLPVTIELARQSLADSPHADRIHFREGNYLTDDYGGPWDLVLMSHITHDEGPEECARMFRQAARSLRGGGVVAVHDWVLDDTGTRPEHSVYFSLQLMLYTEGGRIYTDEAYRQMLAEAGLGNVELLPVLEGRVANPTTLVVARQ